VEPAKEIKTDSLSVEGLEEVFDQPSHTLRSVDDEAMRTASTDLDQWTISEAAQQLKLSTGTIRRRLQNGRLKGFKVEGLNGPEWRIIPPGSIVEAVIENTDNPIETLTSQVDHGSHTQIKNIDQPVQAVPNYPGHTVINEHLVVIKEMQSKLEALTYRNGYLEAQLENHQETIKLLTDSQHKRGRWLNFWSWFTGR
jgi:excisionase family DNA binding protein